MEADAIELDFIMLEKILKQLINSDGMEVTNDYLIRQKIYYIDNVAIIEELEKIMMEHKFQTLFDEKGYVNLEELLDEFAPQYINYDKLYVELQKKYNGYSEEEKEDKLADNTLNKYF